MWAVLLPILIPIAESAVMGVVGYVLAHWGPNLGISPAEGAAIGAALGKLLPHNMTQAVASTQTVPPAA